MDPSESVTNYRPAGYSDDSDSDDGDFSFEPIKLPVRVITVKERYQSIVIQEKFPEFETIFKEELNSDANFIFDNGWTPLMYTCFHGRPAMADYLLERNADPNAHAESTTPLMLLSMNSFATDDELSYIAGKLMDHGAILNLGDRYGITPLMRAVESGRTGLVKIMLERNANIEMRDRQGWTAMFWAVYNRRAIFVEHLISIGARITEVDRYNRTVLDIAEATDNKGIVLMLEPHFTKQTIQSHHIVCSDPEDWFEYYPGLRSDHKMLYKEEMVNMLYGMNCEHLTSLLLNHGVDLGKLLLLEEKDMIKMGIKLQFERRRMKLGIRSFHLRNWKLKAVAGLYASQNVDFSVLDCLEITGNTLMQVYVLNASVLYVAREFKKLQRQISESDDKYLTEMADTIKKWIYNINKMRKEILEMEKLIKIIQDRSPKPVEPIAPPNPYTAVLSASIIGSVTFGLCYLTYRCVVRSVVGLLRMRLK
ncbi:uncharacterized protein [Epargyreus clarus]|uniref:uncharacterized protein isoform X2 n=1 Tax=Epargyreus clarus TaxID=520877 RepID=UPI003C2E3065